MSTEPRGVAAHIIRLEEATLRRWCDGDPSGFLELCAEDVVYFDPFLGRRIDGLPPLADYYESHRGLLEAHPDPLVAHSPRSSLNHVEDHDCR
jgi:ketosteroid isomerase-like protein